MKRPAGLVRRASGRCRPHAVNGWNGRIIDGMEDGMDPIQFMQLIDFKAHGA